MHGAFAGSSAGFLPALHREVKAFFRMFRGETALFHEEDRQYFLVILWPCSWSFFLFGVAETAEAECRFFALTEEDAVPRNVVKRWV